LLLTCGGSSYAAEAASFPQPSAPSADAKAMADKKEERGAGRNPPAASALIPKEPPLADSVTQTVRIEDKFALATARIRWQATKGQMLPVLFEPAVLTRVTYPTNALKLVQAPAGLRRAHQVLAQESGLFEIEMQYQMQVTNR